MITTTIDPSLYSTFKDCHLVAINGSYVNYLLRVRTNKWRTQADATIERLKRTRNEQILFTLSGKHIFEIEDMLYIDHGLYLNRIE